MSLSTTQWTPVLNKFRTAETNNIVTRTANAQPPTRICEDFVYSSGGSVMICKSFLANKSGITSYTMQEKYLCLQLIQRYIILEQTLLVTLICDRSRSRPQKPVL